MPGPVLQMLASLLEVGFVIPDMNGCWAGVFRSRARYTCVFFLFFTFSFYILVAVKMHNTLQNRVITHQEL
jgi:hypothetical protein